MKDDVFLEVEYQKLTKNGQSVCGDDIQVLSLDSENRYLAVLSDGLGSGVKANILATMTTTMALKFLQFNTDILRSVETIMDSLPVCEVRKISYATFSLVDLRFGGTVRITEMGNPGYIHLRETEEVAPFKEQTLVSRRWPDREVRRCETEMRYGDRFIICSDGVTQSGLGFSREFKFGWRRSGLLNFVREKISADPRISAAELSRSVACQALRISNGKCLDDISCLVMYMRKPRVLRILTGPPFYREHDREFARQALLGEEHTIICGGTTATILERELNKKVEVNINDCHSSGALPPPGVMKGIGLVTEGVLTLSHLELALSRGGLHDQPPAAQLIIDKLMSHDRIEFVIGTRVNEMHHLPSMPRDLEFRRSIIRRLSSILESRYRKITTVNFY